MEFSADVLIRIIILILGMCGFFIAKHIYNHKTKNTPLVCPVGFDCHAVVHSDYSKFFGVPVEIFGMIYYAFIFLVYVLSIFMPEVMSRVVSSFMVIASGGAFVFSIYLISVQIFILKKGCSWCIISALVSTLIFVLTMFK